MKTPLILAAFVLAQGFAQGSAQAGSVSIDINGQTVRITTPRNCTDTSCISISTKGFSTDDLTSGKKDLSDIMSQFMPKSDAADTAEAVKPAPATADAPVAVPPAVAPKSTAAPAPKVATLEEAPAAPAPSFDPASPLGLWSTEKKEGIVHIVACGAALCGYKFDTATKTDGVQILINMKPVDATKWSGTIHDPVKGGTYASTLALKGPQTLRVQGCAFGGMICGGQTWSRV